MKMTVHIKLGACQGWRQFVFLPDVQGRACEYRLGVSAVASQFARESHDAINIGPRTILLPLFFKRVHSFTRQVFDQNCVFLVRLIAWRRRLAVTSYRTGPFTSTFCQL